jgi:hypothetical protein
MPGSWRDFRCFMAGHVPPSSQHESSKPGATIATCASIYTSSMLHFHSSHHLLKLTIKQDAGYEFGLNIKSLTTKSKDYSQALYMERRLNTSISSALRSLESRLICLKKGHFSPLTHTTSNNFTTLSNHALCAYTETSPRALSKHPKPLQLS